MLTQTKQSMEDQSAEEQGDNQTLLGQKQGLEETVTKLELEVAELRQANSQGQFKLETMEVEHKQKIK